MLRQVAEGGKISVRWKREENVVQVEVVADDGVNSTTEAEHRQGMKLLAINYNFDFYPCETILENLLQQE